MNNQKKKIIENGAMRHKIDSILQILKPWPEGTPKHELRQFSVGRMEQTYDLIKEMEIKIEQYEADLPIYTLDGDGRALLVTCENCIQLDKAELQEKIAVITRVIQAKQNISNSLNDKDLSLNANHKIDTARMQKAATEFILAQLPELIAMARRSITLEIAMNESKKNDISNT